MIQLLVCVRPWTVFNSPEGDNAAGNICTGVINLEGKNEAKIKSSLVELNNDVKFLSDNGFNSGYIVATQLTSYAAGKELILLKIF